MSQNKNQQMTENEVLWVKYDRGRLGQKRANYGHKIWS
jgi:hypothetical protein